MDLSTTSVFLLGLTLILASISIFILNKKVSNLESKVKSLQGISTSLSASLKSLHNSNEVLIKRIKTDIHNSSNDKDSDLRTIVSDDEEDNEIHNCILGRDACLNNNLKITNTGMMLG